MKKRYLWLLFIVIAYPVMGAGILLAPAEDGYQLKEIDNQYAYINLYDGTQRFLVGINAEIEPGTVWIIPLPAEASLIQSVHGPLIALSGREIESLTRAEQMAIANQMLASQIYPLFFPLRMSEEDVFTGVPQASEEPNMTLSRSLDTGFLEAMNLDFQLDGYEQYIRVKFNSKVDSAAFYLEFPSPEYVYPIKSQNVYGSSRIKADVIIMDSLESEKLRPEINTYKGDLMFQNSIQTFSSNVDDDYFFLDKEKGRIPGQMLDLVTFSHFQYDTKAEEIDEDLFYHPAVAATQRILIQHKWINYVIFLIFSCLASLVSALIVLRQYKPHYLTFAVIGLLNSLTLVGFLVITHLLRPDIRYSTLRGQIDHKLAPFWVWILAVLVCLFILISPVMTGFMNILSILLILALISSFIILKFILKKEHRNRLHNYQLLFTLFFTGFVLTFRWIMI